MSIHLHRPSFRINRRGFIGAASSAIALGAAGRFNVARADDAQLSMMGWADYIAPDDIKAWEAANASKLVYDNYASNDEMYSKLQLAQGNSGYDLGMNTDFMIKLLIDKGLIQKLDESMIANISNIRPDVAHPDFDPDNPYTVPKSTGSDAGGCAPGSFWPRSTPGCS